MGAQHNADAHITQERFLSLSQATLSGQQSIMARNLRPLHGGMPIGGASGSRTHLHGFAIRCITALLSRRAYLTTGSAADSAKPGRLGRNGGAGEESRTLDLYLGKVSLYQLSYSRVKRVRIIKACPWLSTPSCARDRPISACGPLQSGRARPSACSSPSTIASARPPRRSARCRPERRRPHSAVRNRAASGWQSSAPWS
jgi:hypothetical protein